MAKERLHALDGLRALAFSLVMAHHLGIAAIAGKVTSLGYPGLGTLLLSMTASGVELFFVLSGVVLLRPYLRNEKRMNLSTYASRRIQRLYPPYIVALAVSALAAYYTTTHPTWWTSEASLAMFSWREFGAQSALIYFGQRSFNFAYWSLTVEVLFYCLGPIIIIFGAGQGPLFGAGLLALSSTCALTLGFQLWHPPAGTPTGFYQFALYAPCFAMGVLLAVAPLNSQAAQFGMVAGAAYVIASAFHPELNVHAGCALFYGGLVSIACDRTTRAHRMLSKPWAVWLGERSYSLFLMHYSVLTLACALASTAFPSKSIGYFLLTRSVGLGLSLVSACLLFHFVEARFAKGLVTADKPYPWSVSG